MTGTSGTATPTGTTGTDVIQELEGVVNAAETVLPFVTGLVPQAQVAGAFLPIANEILALVETLTSGGATAATATLTVGNALAKIGAELATAAKGL